MNTLTLGELYTLARERGQLRNAALIELDKRIPREEEDAVCKVDMQA